MPDVKIDSKLTTSSADSLAEHARPLYDRLGASRVGIVELRSVERVTPGPGEDKSPAVKLRIIGLEIAHPDQEDSVRDAQRALYLHRTATGTLEEDGEVELSERTLELLPDHLYAAENARLRVVLLHWAHEARKAANRPTTQHAELRKEITRLADGLSAALAGLDAEGGSVLRDGTGLLLGDGA